MKTAALLVLSLVLPACTGLRAQTFSLQTQREPVASLDGLWRFHTGDNPAWASPNFDDSNWPLIRSGESWTRQGYPVFNGYAWYRFKVEVPGNGQPVDLLLTPIFNGYQVYANGKLIGGEGTIVPTRNPVIAILPAVYRLPPESTGPQFIQIAIRVWCDTGMGLDCGSLQPGNIAGAPAVLTRELSHDESLRTTNVVNSYGYCLLASLVGLATLVLFLLRPEDREYLWFSILLLAIGAEAAFGIVSWTSVPTPRILSYAVSSAAAGASVIAALLFFSIVLRTPRSFLWWLACAGTAIYPIGLLFYGFRWTSWGEGHAIGVILMFPADVWFISTLAVSTIRKGVAVRWLLAPAVLYYGSKLLGHISYVALQLGWRKTSIPLDFVLISRPFPLNLSDVFGYVFILSLLNFLVRRFSAARQEEARLSQEIEAARTVQSLLVPSRAQATPGFTVESVYLPAHEVGGDFFHIQHGDDASLLIIVGDVSGKGLKAAMTVSAIVGALRGCALRAPAEVLAYLNRVLHGQITGFATCAVASIAADGAMTIANAGHLSPYCNGKELPIANGLPLGITATASYEETHFKLAPNDRLTFISDGVVEAANSKRELFGFDRTEQIITQPAAAIAQAAQQWGQDDDITVLTVARAAAIA